MITNREKNCAEPFPLLTELCVLNHDWNYWIFAAACKSSHKDNGDEDDSIGSVASFVFGAHCDVIRSIFLRFLPQMKTKKCFLTETGKTLLYLNIPRRLKLQREEENETETE